MVQKRRRDNTTLTREQCVLLMDFAKFLAFISIGVSVGFLLYAMSIESFFQMSMVILILSILGIGSVILYIFAFIKHFNN